VEDIVVFLGWAHFGRIIKNYLNSPALPVDKKFEKKNFFFNFEENCFSL